MKRIHSIIAAALCTSMCVCACSSQDSVERPEDSVVSETEDVKKETKKEAKEEKKYQKKLEMIHPSAYDNVMGLELEEGTALSVIGKADGVPYWEEVKRGAEQAVEDINENLGYEGRDRVKVTYSAPGTPDNVDEQVNILDEELARYPVGLSISIADTKACGVQFDLASDNGIPIVAFDSGSDYQGLMATVATDNSGSARIIAEKMAELIGNSGEVIVFVQDSMSMSAKERENGFMERMAEDYPEISVVQVYHIDQMEEIKKEIAKEKMPQDAEEEAETEELTEEITEEEILDYILGKHPQLKGIYATDGTTVKAAVKALKRSEREDITLVGYDGDEEELDALKDGRVKGLMIQNPFGMGYAAVVASARAALSMGNEAYIDTGVMWVTQDNLDSEAVKAWLY